MNYTEKYEVRRKSRGEEIIGPKVFETETEAIKFMNAIAYGSGVWSVVRVMEVTVASVVKG
ncbi:hypothetical protein ACIPJG_32290 [Streptomyces halstedii]|uniref:hypothetical protein n=1 Tax=Streptomyces halstedii TaxID=1944 RepID=UPI003827943D